MMILDVMLTLFWIILLAGFAVIISTTLIIILRAILMAIMIKMDENADKRDWKKKLEDAEMNKFQIGDIVVSEINRYDGGLTKGKCYGVVAKHYDEISVIFDNGITGTARYSNFKLYSGPNMDKVEEYYEILQAQELMQDAQERPPRQDTTEVLP